MYAINVIGHPKGQPRAKSRAFKNKAGKTISTVYNPSGANGWKSLIRAAILENRPERKLEGPLYFYALFRFPRPKSHYRTGKNSHLIKDTAPEWYDKTPDNDNLEKACWDAISDTGIVWNDDKQIASNFTCAIYTQGDPGCEIQIVELHEIPPACSKLVVAGLPNGL